MDIGLKVAWCRNPIKLGLVRHVIPLLGFCSAFSQPCSDITGPGKRLRAESLAEKRNVVWV